MPLRDHFRPPLSEISSWEEVHGGWPMVMVQQLHKILPPQYTAGPRIHLGAEVEIDVATFESEPVPDIFRSLLETPMGADTAWEPAEPTLAVETELSDFDEYEVRIYDTRRGRRLVAAIELVSPANKDRPEHRSQFTSKCSALLRQGVLPHASSGPGVAASPALVDRGICHPAGSGSELRANLPRSAHCVIFSKTRVSVSIRRRPDHPARNHSLG